MADLGVTIAGVRFKNPIIAASAPTTHTVKRIKKAIDAGVGGVVLKTVSPGEGCKYPRPRYSWQMTPGQDKHNFMMFETETHCPYDINDYCKMVREAKEISGDVPIIASVMANTEEDWIDLATKVEAAGADMIELNLSHPIGLKVDIPDILMIGQSPDATKAVVELVKSVVKLPVMAKLTPQCNNLTVVAKFAAEAGVDGITAINGFSGMDIDVEEVAPLLGTYPSFLGPWLKGIGLRWVSDMALKLELPIAATGGAVDGLDAAKYILAGASVVQIATVIMLKGYGAITDMVNELNAYMDRKGFENLEQMRGKALEKLKEHSEIEKEPPVAVRVDEKQCVGCGKCARVCLFDAIRIENHKAVIDIQKCDGCGVCASLATNHCMEMYRYR